MTGEEDLLRAIRDEPDNDDVRLVYADWLDDHGRSARAELIRVQCQAEALPKHDPERDKLEAHAKQLIEKHGPDWHGPLRDFGYALSPTYERGMPRLSITAGNFVRKPFQEIADEWFIRAGVHHLTIYDATRKVEALAESSLLRHIGILWLLDNKFEDEGFTTVINSPHLSNVHSLRIRRQLNSNASYRALAKAKHLRGLRSFTLEGSASRGDFEVTPKAIDILLKSKSLPNLTQLAIFQKLGATFYLHDILKFESLTELERLELRESYALRTEHVIAITECEHLVNLRHLSIQGVALDEATTRALLDSPHLANLETLHYFRFEGLTKRTRTRLEKRFTLISPKFE